MPETIFITGATGFIGSHLVEGLLTKGHNVMALKRRNSSLWRCEKFNDRIIWVNKEDANWKKEVVVFRPQLIIHSAWDGIDAKERMQWERQFSNLDLLLEILAIAKEAGAKKFIAFGSQAEYGYLNSRVNESGSLNPISPYGVTKLAARNTVRIFCNENNIEWYWPIIFSVFGPKENKEWFIPMIINKLLRNEECDLTLCEQKYDYLYVGDFVKMFLKLIQNTGKSGIYNMSSNSSIQLIQIVKIIAELVQSKSKINFGALPYRPDQSKHIEGDSSLFINTFGAIPYTSMQDALSVTIKHYKNAIYSA